MNKHNLADTKDDESIYKNVINPFAITHHDDDEEDEYSDSSCDDMQGLLSESPTKFIQKKEAPRHYRRANMMETLKVPNALFRRGRAHLLLLCLVTFLLSIFMVGHLKQRNTANNNSLVSDKLEENKSEEETDDMVPLKLGSKDGQMDSQGESESDSNPKHDEIDTREKQQPKDHVDVNIGSDVENNYDCNGKDDRLENKIVLKAGEYICSKKGQYIFGMSDQGHLIFRDENANKTKTLKKGSPGSTFMLTESAEFVVYNDKKKIKWNKECKVNTVPTAKCLPQYNCPYLHLHNDGVIVLNWIDDMHAWNTKSIKKTCGVKYKK